MDEHAEVVELDAATEYCDRVAAIDIAKASAMVCTRVPSDKDPGRRAQKTFPVKATTHAIAELADHLVCQSIALVVMEATGDYWRPFFYQLEARGLRVWLVNPRQVKNVPSRPKTDKLDAIWLAKLAERGMLRPSFVPPEPIRHLRDLTRAHTALTADRTKYANRIQDLLEDACLKLGDKNDGPTDLFGISGRAMLDALCAGERNPRTLAELARGRMRVKIPALTEALTGHFTDHHARLIRMWLDDYDRLSAQIDQLNHWITEAIDQLDYPTGPGDSDPPDDDQSGGTTLLARLDQIPGIGPDTAAVIIAEIGTDMTVFPTPAHLASWAHLTPRTIASGTKNTHGPAGKGNGWLKGPLGQAAVSASTTKTFLGARYRRLAKHIPKKKAQVAIARNILEIAWHLINDPHTTFHDLGTDWHDRHTNTARKTRQAIHDLEHLGYTVTLTPATT